MERDRQAMQVAFVVAGTHSGCGKTSMALALMAAFRKRGWRVRPFKVGPDFIDPGFHGQVTGRTSYNLDGWMLSRDYNRALFGRSGRPGDVSVVEGVMGLFDGYDGRSEAGSTAQMAKWLDIPVVLVVDARSMARSVAALVRGYTRFDPGLRFVGVVFNRIGSPAHLQFLCEAMDEYLPEVAVLGGVMRDDSIRLASRHLGLVTADEAGIDAEKVEKLAGLVESSLDLDLLLERARWNPALHGLEGDRKVPVSPPVTVAVARDPAFCFYYPDNLEWLEAAGARLRFFSPLGGETLPTDAGAVYLGGGYPEVHAEALAGNTRFLSDLRSAADTGMPIYGECGGLMTLSRFIETVDGKRHLMAGLLPFATRMLERRKALGYTEVVLTGPCLLGDAGLSIRGHEFHYSEIFQVEADQGLDHVYLLRARKYRAERWEGFRRGSVLGSYVHLHWGSEPRAAAHLVAAARRYRQGG